MITPQSQRILKGLRLKADVLHCEVVGWRVHQCPGEVLEDHGVTLLELLKGIEGHKRP